MSEATPNDPLPYSGLILRSIPGHTKSFGRAPQPYAKSKATTEAPPPYRRLALPSIPSHTDIFIAIMGVTGSGKSSFIKHCAGDDNIRIGHSLESCTKDVQIHFYMHSTSIRVNLVDTPGFDDDNLTDADILEEISGWLYASYKRSIKLNGLLYLQRITDTRMQGSSMKNLAVFKSLCGLDALQQVTLVTTMWDKESCREEFEGREKELLGNNRFWGAMVRDHGACTGRHDNTQRSAMHLLARFIQQPESTVVTDLQRELIDDERRLEETAAGKAVMTEINKAAERAGKELRRTEQALQILASGAREQQSAFKAELEVQKAALEEKLRKLEEQEGKLKEADAQKASEKWSRYFKAACALIIGVGAAAVAAIAGPHTAVTAMPVIISLTAKVMKDELRKERNETDAESTCETE